MLIPFLHSPGAGAWHVCTLLCPSRWAPSRTPATPHSPSPANFLQQGCNQPFKVKHAWETPSGAEEQVRSAQCKPKGFARFTSPLCLALQPSLDRFSGPEGTTATNSGGSMLVCFELFAFSLHKANESLVTLMVRCTQSKGGRAWRAIFMPSSTRTLVLCRLQSAVISGPFPGVRLRLVRPAHNAREVHM
jgi:hypothetical protein